MGKAMKFFNDAAKVVPVISALVGASLSAAGGYIAINSELTELRRQNEYLEARFANHLAGFDHDAWFSPDWICHPALRGALERRERQLGEQLEIKLFKERAREWQRFCELNPSLVRPGSY